MKKTLVILILSLFTNHLFAGTKGVDIWITNNSKYKFKVTENINGNCSDCILCHDEKFERGLNEMGDFLRPHFENFPVRNHYEGPCGVSGYLNFECFINGKIYKGRIDYSVPYIGENKYTYTIDAPFRLYLQKTDYTLNHHISLSFNLEGGPGEVINTIILPQVGNNSIVKYISIDPTKVNIPNGVGLLDIFDVAVLAPSIFQVVEGYTEPYKGNSGRFLNAIEVGKINYYQLPTASDGLLNIRLEITNLPEDIPLTPTFNLNSKVRFEDPTKTRPQDLKPCSINPVVYPTFVVNLEQIMENKYNVNTAYRCDKDVQNQASSNVANANKEKQQMVTNPTDWRNKNAIIFKDSKISKFNTLKINKIKLNKTL
ncbi:hypothetical protein EZJ43_11455 [Pedobacter changchengzhani]|uniref:Uncharacterized protein n=1 Tax=Pedobacter changchengzhani TaxID=2529274 RepID=A0A4R5MJV3_9SPHI|nr:hypothetical protein [Pedobacter changchengzhani]TDG35957.1 hypothetical protein EZJ43_11455 [Pedobacter changchengzhani]